MVWLVGGCVGGDLDCGVHGLAVVLMVGWVGGWMDWWVDGLVGGWVGGWFGW